MSTVGMHVGGGTGEGHNETLRQRDGRALLAAPQARTHHHYSEARVLQLARQDAGGEGLGRGVGATVADEDLRQQA